MATWAPLRRLLAEVDHSVTLTWKELNDLVGGLPPSAEQYREFWAGDRSGWPGFRTKNVQIGRHVTFERTVRSGSAVAAAKSHGGVASRVVARVDLDGELVVRAAAATGIADKDVLVHEALETLIRLASARKLAALGGTDPGATAPPRRRDGIA